MGFVIMNCQNSKTISEEVYYIAPDNILFEFNTINRNTALNKIGHHLVKNNIAKSGVVGSAIEREKTSSTLLENKWAAIPHAETKYIDRSQISLLIAPKGIDWGTGLARLVFFMGFTQQEIQNISMNKIYHEFNELLEQKSVMEQLVNSKSNMNAEKVLMNFFLCRK
ncbi:PTS sugar transporter subunit IIA [Lactobacillus sp. ESL0791]|uniref:PTS sugar transporter subunit IIA n=1 Tax=Lactobacillus sp. ESL0791 TaxID=2983234 RepID=UPI0023F9A924|nr:PTS sugar transporter subunit IIA [Lactobacillus sp. ESL0791]MDF7639270.1 PTS sugar transporter subunit IIA [Lactobacillus sp. ESL0791]